MAMQHRKMVLFCPRSRKVQFHIFESDSVTGQENFNFIYYLNWNWNWNLNLNQLLIQGLGLNEQELEMRSILVRVQQVL